MENQTGLKLRISRMFRSSFASCRTRHIADVMEKAVFAPPSSTEPSSPKTTPCPPTCRPKTISDTCILSFNDSHSLSRRKISHFSSPFLWANNATTTTNNNLNLNLGVMSCPPLLRAFPSAQSTNTTKQRLRIQRKGSDEDDETDTLFSSKSLSSDSSMSRRRGRKNDRSSDMGVLPLHGKVKDTFAVVKRSSDPYSDFRTSMLEMIVEKQIFSPADLENLLQCFLSLNSYHHHKIIVQVFTEIWEALFSDWF
ncbi:hypothetical protein ACSQ67_005173 [Phaseolus vulgaris]